MESANGVVARWVGGGMHIILPGTPMAA